MVTYLIFWFSGDTIKKSRKQVKKRREAGRSKETKLIACTFSRRNFSLVARYSLKFTRCSLLVVKSTRYSLQKLLVAKNHSLIVAKSTRYSLQKITRYSLQNLLITRCRSCSLQKSTHYWLQDSLVTRCRSCSLQKNTHYLLKNSLVTRCKYSLVTHYAANFDRYLLCKVTHY